MNNKTINVTIYQEKFPADDKLRDWIIIEKLIQSAIDSKIIPHNFSCIDLGCGNGYTVKLIADKFPKSVVIGVDKHRGDTGDTGRPIGYRKNFAFVEGEILDILSWSGIEGDVVIMQNIWHVPNVVRNSIGANNKLKLIGGTIKTDTDWFKKVESYMLEKYKVVIVNVSDEQYDVYETGRGFYNNDLKLIMNKEEDNQYSVSQGQLVSLKLSQ